MEENNTDGKRKIPPSIPANYISILQLQERWIKEKERKRKEEEEGEEERRREQQAEEQQRTEEDLKKAEEDLDENRASQSNRKHCGRTSKKNESIDGGEARWDEKEETAAIGSERGEDAAPGDEGIPVKKRGRRKRYDSKKKRTNLEVASVKEGVVDECGSIPPPECVVTENHTPVKEAILVHRKKGEKATAVETQFEDLSIERGETKNLKAQTRSSNRNRQNQKNDLRPRRVRMPTPTETATMVWVKKGQNQRADDGNGSGVNPLNA